MSKSDDGAINNKPKDIVHPNTETMALAKKESHQIATVSHPNFANFKFPANIVDPDDSESGADK